MLSLVWPAVASSDRPPSMGSGHEAAIEATVDCCLTVCSNGERTLPVIPLTTTVSPVRTPTSAVEAKYVLR
jgi:hypothetical protein